MTVGRWLMVELQALAQAVPAIGLGHLIGCLHKAELGPCLLQRLPSLPGTGRRPVISTPEVGRRTRVTLATENFRRLEKSLLMGLGGKESPRKAPSLKASLGYMSHHLKKGGFDGQSVWSYGPYPDSSRSLAVVMTR